MTETQIYYCASRACQPKQLSQVRFAARLIVRASVSQKIYNDMLQSNVSKLCIVCGSKGMRSLKSRKRTKK